MKLMSWSNDPLWATFYDWSVEHPVAGGVAWKVGIDSDLRRLYRATEEISLLPAGSRILDIPCGGGVALRGLTPGQGVEYVAADIAEAMLDRTMEAAAQRGVADQVLPRVADVEDLPFPDDDFDLVVSFTGLHCFPDPQRAVVEMVRVLKPGAVITGSVLLNDGPLRVLPIRVVGRISGLIGPSCTADELGEWLDDEGIIDVTIERSGAMGYFRGVKHEGVGVE